MTTNFTPGPWNLPDTGKPLVSAGSIQTGWNGMVARADAGDYARSYEEGMANARLIAAAPDLLLALQELLFCARHGNGLKAHHEAQDRAAAAIAKARGEG